MRLGSWRILLYEVPGPSCKRDGCLKCSARHSREALLDLVGLGPTLQGLWRPGLQVAFEQIWAAALHVLGRALGWPRGGDGNYKTLYCDPESNIHDFSSPVCAHLPVEQRVRRCTCTYQSRPDPSSSFIIMNVCMCVPTCRGNITSRRHLSNSRSPSWKLPRPRSTAVITSSTTYTLYNTPKKLNCRRRRT